MPSPSPMPLASDPAAEARRRRSILILAVVAALTILVPFLFWKQTWFGQPLTDAQIAEYLADNTKPRHMQQALVQIQERIERGDSSATRWYPQMAALKDSPVTELRVTLAWVLGTDNRSELFHQTLLRMLHDPELLVRRNAALSLVRFRDAAGRSEIRQMLEPYTLRASQGGTLRYRLQEGNSLEAGTTVARIELPNGSTAELGSPLPGKLLRRIVADGTAVREDQEIAAIAPAEDHVWEGLHALLLIGQADDLPLIDSFVHASDADYSSRIREQAALTAAEIRKRESVNSTQRRGGTD